jgi:hypothetical protein
MNSSEGELRGTQIGKTIIEGESTMFLTVAEDVARRAPETIA